jgi:rhodanese-related sulfurtransferase
MTKGNVGSIVLDWLTGKKSGTGEVQIPLAMTADELDRERTGLYLVDLRDLTAYRKGHIKGAHLIPYLELRTRVHEIPLGVSVVTVDSSERRARQAAKLLRQDGYAARYLKGGLGGWTGKLVK